MSLFSSVVLQGKASMGERGLLPVEGLRKEANVPVVVEIGSANSKVGWAGELHPESYRASSVCRQHLIESSSQIASRLKRGNNDDKCDKTPVSSPQNAEANPLSEDESDRVNPIDPQTGLLAIDDDDDIDSMEAFVHQFCKGFRQLGFRNFANFKSCDKAKDLLLKVEQPLLMIEKSYNPTKLRMKLAEIVFEHFDVPKFFLAKDAVLACYGVGRTSGIVVDIGALGTTVSPVYDGWVESIGIERSSIGGDASDRLLLSTIDSLTNNRAAKYLEGRKKWDWLEFARDTKKIVAGVGTSGRASIEKKDSTGKSKEVWREYTLPDDTRVRLPESRLKNELSEIFFRPDQFSSKMQIEDEETHSDKEEDGPDGNSAIPTTLHPLQHMICDSALKCDRDQQAILLEQVIVTGGGSCLPGFTDRIKNEVESLIHTHTPGWNVKVTGAKFSERVFGSWLGGSILCSLPFMDECWITKQNYEEHGPSIVSSMCP